MLQVGATETLDRYVTRLRKKLNFTQGHFMQTVKYNLGHVAA
jgi:DNA-binding response OmpR family regulator